MKKSFLLVLLLMICSLALFGCKDKKSTTEGDPDDGGNTPGQVDDDPDDGD